MHRDPVIHGVYVEPRTLDGGLVLVHPVKVDYRDALKDKARSDRLFDLQHPATVCFGLHAFVWTLEGTLQPVCILF